MADVAGTLNHAEVEQDAEKQKIVPTKTGESEDPKGGADESAVIDSSVNAEKSEDAGDDQDSGSDSDESLPPGLLERPVEIMENKRERKKIKRFTYDDDKASPSVKTKPIEVPKGNGIKLSNHPRVECQLARNTGDDLKIIHRFFFGVSTSSRAVKKNLREFCGFVMDKDSPQYEKKEEFIGKFTLDNLKWAMTVCDVPNIRGKKEDLIDSFMDWCLCPKPQDKPAPGYKGKKVKGQKKTKKIKRSRKQIENGNTTLDATTAKKPKATPVKRKKNADKKPSPGKKARIKVTPQKSKPKIDYDDSDSSDNEPLHQKKKSPPTNADIQKFVENLLKDADLEVITMKVVFQQVNEHYPDFDLADRKAFIKETVKKIIS